MNMKNPYAEIEKLKQLLFSAEKVLSRAIFVNYEDQNKTDYIMDQIRVIRKENEK